jgi:hypothetical protein
MAKAPVKQKAVVAKDVDYTIPGLIAIVATVLLTALFFAQPNVAEGANLSGQAYGAAESSARALSPDTCEVSSYCDGSRLVRQGADCQLYEAFCTRGCSDVSGHAVCLS